MEPTSAAPTTLVITMKVGDPFRIIFVKPIRLIRMSPQIIE